MKHNGCKWLCFFPLFFCLIQPQLLKAQSSVELQHFWVSPGENNALQQIVRHAEDQGIHMSVFDNKDYNALRENISERISLGYPPEMTHWIGGEDLSKLGESGLLLAMPDELNGEKLSSILKPEILAEVVSNDEVIALPVGVHLQSVAIYNMKMLDSIGYKEAPSDWESYFEMTEKLSDAGMLPIALSDELWVVRETLHGILSSIEQKQALVDIYADFDQRGKLLENLERAFDILLKLRQYADEGHVSRNWSDAVKMVVEGKAASVFMGDFAQSEIAHLAGNDTEDYVCAPMPGKQAAYFGVDIFVMFNNKVEDWVDNYSKLASVVLDAETQRDYLSYKGGLSVIQNIEESTLNQCSQASSDVWKNNPTQRFSSPGPRDNERIALLHEVLPIIWNSEDMDAEKAAKLTYDSLAKDRLN